MIRGLAKLTRRGGRAFAGNCDGVDGREVCGWAWRPDTPQARLEIEQWVDGVLKASVVADQHRADLAEAGIGDGAYGWRMPLVLDPGRSEPQTVEFRLGSGEVLPNGTFVSIYVPAADTASEPAGADSGHGGNLAFGVCDGRDGGAVRGWAWRPLVPEDRVIVEQWVDGALVGEVVADALRADLTAAGIGDGCYAWRMPLALDPEQAEPQSVQLRIRGAGPVVGGEFVVSAQELQAEDTAPAEASGVVIGHCDGLKGSALHGWAKDPANPDVPVEIELWLDGACVARTLADGFRPDLRANRVGGRHGWRLPVDLRKLEKPVQAEVRTRGGQLLQGGRLELQNNVALDNPMNVDLQPFVEAVLRARPQAPRAKATVHTFLLYAPAPTKGGPFWAREYDDYPGALRAFAPALARHGEVAVLERLEDAAALCAERDDLGRQCLLLSFGPPRLAPLEAPCPVVPVFAWAFPTLPTGSWDGDPRSDWRKVLGFTGRAITFSAAAAEAVRAAMGPAFPVAVLPPPAPEKAPTPPTTAKRTLRLKGAFLDSRGQDFDPERQIIPKRIWTGGDDIETGQDVEIEGVLFTAVLDLDDKRKNWSDLVSAFVAANRERAEATLLLKLSWPDPKWMSDLYKCLDAQPAFACRVLAIRGPMDEEDFERLIAASHWYVSSSSAEGLCLAMQGFLAAGRPVVAPLHTAIADHLIDAQNGLVVDCDEEDLRWPTEGEDGGFSWTQHPDDVGPTTRWRISWLSLFNGLREAYRLVVETPGAYAQLCASATAHARARLGPEATDEALAQILDPRAAAPTPPLPRSLTVELATG